MVDLAQLSVCGNYVGFIGSVFNPQYFIVIKLFGHPSLQG
jgi:hypothetical protein